MLDEEELTSAWEVLQHKYGEDVAQEAVAQALRRCPSPLWPWIDIRARRIARRTGVTDLRRAAKLVPLPEDEGQASRRLKRALAVIPSAEDEVIGKEEVARLLQAPRSTRFRIRRLARGTQNRQDTEVQPCSEEEEAA